jgi:hypothetical protein
MASYVSRLFYSPFFQNKFVLYGSLFIVLLSILRYLANNNVNAVILMALIGLVMSYFSKNMIIVLLTAFASVFLLEMVGSRGVMEGMKTKEGAKNNGDDETDETDDGEKDADEKKDASSNKKDTGSKKKKKDAGVKENETTQKKSDKQGMAKLSPASYDGKDHDDEGDATNPKGSSNRIDYASTLEQAYDNIENIIGEDGVRGLTDQTKSLMNQQKQLMENMKDMGPLLKSAEGFMKQITGGGGIGGITDMLKGFATPGGKPAAESEKK